MTIRDLNQKYRAMTKTDLENKGIRSVSLLFESFQVVSENSLVAGCDINTNCEMSNHTNLSLETKINHPH